MRLGQFCEPEQNSGFRDCENSLLSNVGQVFLGWWLGLSWSYLIGPVGKSRWTELEADAEFALFQRGEIVDRQNEDSILAVWRLDVAVLSLGCIGETKMNTHWVS